MIPVPRTLIRRLAPVLAPAVVITILGCREDAESPLAPESPPTTLQATVATEALAFRQVSAGSFFTCGVTTEFRAYCWGSNANGELGIGTLWEPEFCADTSTCSPRPIAVAGGLRFKAVASGGLHACGVTTESRAYCWGDDAAGQLGRDGTLDNPYAPAPVAGTLQFRQVSAGSVHTCGVTKGNRAYCWGNGSSRPVAVPGGLRFRQVSAESNHTCGLTTENQAYCWGAGADQLNPVRVRTTKQFAQLDAGFNYTCAVTLLDRAFCWGSNSHGQLGNGTTARRDRPQVVVGGLSFERVTAGFIHTCGATTTNRAYCWGANGNGQLGDGTTSQRLRPVAVAGGQLFKQLSAGDAHTCGLTSDGLVYCWGDNSAGQLGDGTRTERLTPIPVAAL